MPNPEAKNIELLEQMLKKLTDLYYEAKKLDNSCAEAIGAAEDTVIDTLKYLRGINAETKEIEPTLYVHDYDVKVQIASFSPKGGDLYSGELKKRIIKSLESMDDKDFWMLCDCRYSVGPDQHGTTASDWGIHADSD